MSLGFLVKWEVTYKVSSRTNGNENTQRFPLFLQFLTLNGANLTFCLT